MDGALRCKVINWWFPASSNGTRSISTDAGLPTCMRPELGETLDNHNSFDDYYDWNLNAP